MRILFEMMPQLVGGGEVFLTKLIGALDTRKYQPVILFYGPGKAVDHARRAGHEVLIFPYRDRKKKISQLADFLVRHRIDLVQSGYFSLELSLAANLAGIAHLWRVGGHIDVVYPSWNARKKRDLLRLMSGLCRQLICPTQHLANQFREAGCRNVMVIRNALVIDELKKYARQSLPRRLPGIERGRPGAESVIMLAHILPQKRHEDLVEALRKLKRTQPRLQAYFVGGGYRQGPHRRFPGKLRRRIEREGLAKQIWVGECGPERYALLRKSPVAILPSENEGSSNAILEAMALGVPVIASRSGGNGELVKDKATGLLVPCRHPEALAKAIAALWANPRRAKKMGAAGARRVRKVFGMARCARAFEQLYRRHGPAVKARPTK